MAMSLLVGDLSCQQAVELVTDYLEGTLSRRDRRKLERHLRACDGCDAYLEQVRAVQVATGRVGPEDLDATTLEGLVRLFREHQGDDEA
jgi:anti-sigma factor RsiW